MDICVVSNAVLLLLTLLFVNLMYTLCVSVYFDWKLCTNANANDRVWGVCCVSLQKVFCLQFKNLFKRYQSQRRHLKTTKLLFSIRRENFLNFHFSFSVRSFWFNVQLLYSSVHNTFFFVSFFFYFGVGKTANNDTKLISQFVDI